jgi:hypothetical protein
MIFSMPAPMNGGVERLISTLEGVLSASAVLDEDGGVTEVRVLARSDHHPKRVVRNIESALAAAFGIEIDRRVVTVELSEAPAGPPARARAAELPTVADAAPDPPRPAARIVFAGFDSRAPENGPVTCTVTLTRGDRQHTGTGTGPASLQGRADAGARAAFAALASAAATDDLALEGAALVDADRKTFVLVSAWATDGRSRTPLSGAALLDRSPEEAAILAALQASNRWLLRS